ncbi:glycoside hydrolase family 13 protein [Aliivibrio fischeri]|uniref:glycoside hydrolase family 13 protein n=1 Tax=Aliivibrio fischeri TaxID=668 RepID=UPI001F26559E|nr:glycoside hydrolase family 13 protein [Aliivibrio fischeri]MCE7554422.1 alpha-glycosidase [Aliivibrio fischeri]MCE7561690.1 alpha-glycosidase [Aliivibrio fischeri]MCE7569098.1 alpha-glycosidase [Aliivibrio fischeri]
MITKAAIYHRSHSSYSYAYDKDTLHLRIRTAKGEVDNATLRIGDPYDWTFGGGGGNLNAEDASGWTGGTNLPMIKECETELFDYWFCEAQPRFYRARYAFLLEGKDSEKLLVSEKLITQITDDADPILSQLLNFYCFPYMNPTDVFNAPEWVKETIWYQIFPERFANGDPSISPKNVLPWGSEDPKTNSFFGGDLQGVIDHLDYLQDLGITGIYFTPITQGETNHKYDTTDYLKVDPAFGSDETVHTLIDEAHKRGMKVMLDAVFNHIGANSTQWQDVIKHGKDSQYIDWFYVEQFPLIDESKKAYHSKEQLNYRAFAFAQNMPKLNTENAEVIEYLIEVGRYWVKNFDIDAWRLDVANEVDQRFWRRFRDELKAIKPELYILGEVWHDSMNWLGGDQFDGVMNYPLADAMLGFFAHDNLSANQFKFAVNDVNANYPINVNEVAFSLLDSHDTPRIINRCNGNKEKAKLAYLFQFTHSGTPCIYYGGEIGLDGGADPLNRKCMIWDERQHDMNMKHHIMQLIKLRKAHPALRAHAINWLVVDDEQQCFIYQKEYQGERIIIAMNNSNAPACMTLPSEWRDQEVTDIYHETAVKLTQSLTVPAFGFAVYQI